MGRLEYKLAIVTGCTSDFGASAATALAGDGATVLLTDTNDAAGETLAASLRASGLKAEYHRLDTSDAMGWAKLADQIMRTHGHLDVLVNIAGAYISATIEDATAQQLRDILEADLIGPFLGLKAVIPAMRQSGGGGIINIVANPIVAVLPLAALYSTAKAGLAGLTKSTAMHCTQRGYDIRVNNVHPGAHETEVLTAKTIRSTTAAELHPLLNTLPLRPEGQEQNFAEAIAFLASDEARDITGADIFTRGPLTGLTFTPAPGGL